MPRTLPALVTLELMDEKGEPSPTFQKIRTVPQAEYQTCLAEWLRSVYADVFAFVDPAKDDAVRVRDAFRSYVPPGQQDRMVALFLALCTEAGIVAEGKTLESKPAARKPFVARTVNTGGRTKAAAPASTGNSNNAPTLPPALAGILQSIPSPQTGWTKEARDRFVTAFGHVLDFAIPIKSAESVSDEEGTP